MSHKGKMIFKGIVQKITGSEFIVLIEQTQSLVKAVLSGKIKQNTIKITTGDKVSIEVSGYDLSRGTIIFREK